MNGSVPHQIEGDRDEVDGPDHENQARGRNIRGRRDKNQKDKDIHVVIEDGTESHLISSSRLVLDASGGFPQTRHNSSQHTGYESFENSCVMVPENEIEAHRICNNYRVSLQFLFSL